VVFVAFRCACCNAVHLEPDTWVRATVVFFIGWLEVFRVSDRLESRENAGKLLTAPGLADGA
jgi:hypothetical protein